MAILDNIKNLFTTKSLGTSIGSVVRNFNRQPEFNPRNQVTGITYKAIDKVGQTLSVYKPIVERQSGETMERHPIYDLFRNPNSKMNAVDFIHLFGMQYEIYGETFWYLERGESTRQIKAVYLLNPERIEVKVSGGELVGYVLHKNSGNQVPLEIDEVYHDKRPNPFNEWRGLSVLEKAAVYVNTEIKTANFTMNYIANNASPSGIVTLPDMDREAFKLFTQQWRQGYEGPENAGKTAFIRNKDADFKAVGATLKDIDQEITRNMAKEDVLAMFDMPKAMIGMVDEKGFNRASVETLKLIYAENKLDPLMQRLDRIYEDLIEIGFPRQGGVNVTHESPIPEDREFEHKIHKDLVNVALTVNEVRAKLGYEEIEGGDDLRPESRPPRNPQTEASLKVVKKKEPSKKELLQKQEDEGENLRQKLENITDLYSKRVKTEISDFVREQEESVIDSINASEKAFDEWLFSIKEESEELASLLTPILIEMMEEHGEDVSHFITGELLTISPEIRQEVTQDIKKIAGVFNEDTYKALEQTLAQGQTAGESLNKLKQRVESVFTDAKGYRAERIARTESARAGNKATELVYKQNGITEVEWRTNPGACEFCAAMQGRRKSVGNTYLNQGDVLEGVEGGKLRIDYEAVMHPPAHPNCTCSLDPVA